MYNGASQILVPELFYKDSSFSHQTEKRVVVIDDCFAFRFHQPFDEEKNIFQRNVVEMYDRLIDLLDQELCKIIQPESYITKKDGISVKITIPLIEK